ncbi:MAG TPA: PIN domain-containing protein [Vicinamibacteria bacterium]|nr:PIN domain-containing protein [Vicinamibacteria bacterium]
MGALIDSSILVAAERGRLDLESALAKHQDSQFAISAITASELLHGVHRARGEARRGRRQAFVEGLLSSIPVISFDLVAARAHARIWAKLAARGVTVGAHDLLIAATAVSRGMDVVTHDTRSFPKVPGLKLVRW